MQERKHTFSDMSGHNIGEETRSSGTTVSVVLYIDFVTQHKMRFANI